MLATIPEFREVNFSHLQFELTGPEPVGSVRKQQSTLLWLALLLSSLLHLLLLLFEFSVNQPRFKQAPAKVLHIDLLLVPAKTAATDAVTEEIAELQSAVKVASDIAVAPVPVKVIISTEKSSEAKPATRLLIEPLSAQELAEVVDSQNAPTDYQGLAAIAENVFHPGLRAQLTEEASKPVLARVEDSGPQTYTDPSGATVVVLGNGKCLKSPMNTKIGAPQNWYMTFCGGKSESEEMMEQIEQSVNGKLEFNANDEL